MVDRTSSDQILSVCPCRSLSTSVPLPPRCPRMSGGVTPAAGRTTRSLAAGWGAAATSKPWETRRAGSRTPAPKRRLSTRRCGRTPWSKPSCGPENCWTPTGISCFLFALFLLFALLFFLSCLWLWIQIGTQRHVSLIFLYRHLIIPVGWENFFFFPQNCTFAQEFTRNNKSKMWKSLRLPLLRLSNLSYDELVLKSNLNTLLPVYFIQYLFVFPELFLSYSHFLYCYCNAPPPQNNNHFMIFSCVVLSCSEVLCVSLWHIFY